MYTKFLIHIQDENKKKEEKKPEPKPEPKPFKMPKKVEKKPEPEPEPVPEEPKKIVKKKPSVKPKEEPKEEEPPFAMKLKKTERVQREWKDPEMETVKLAHHEFEKAPQPVEVNMKMGCFLGSILFISDVTRVVLDLIQFHGGQKANNFNLNLEINLIFPIV